jgi:hypothetical protein
MYFIGKFLQAAGLTILLIAWIQKFPNLMSYKTLAIGICTFASGWIITQFLLKNK